jgi:predicted outer membrane repeat protein
MGKLVLFTATIVAFLAAVPLAQAATWGVSNTTDTPVGQQCPTFTGCSLREAITSTEANPGADTILVSAGTYPLTNGELTVTQDLAIARVGAGAATIQGSGSRILGVTGSGTDLDLKFMALANGSANGNGGAINAGPGTTLTVESSTISNSSATASGAVSGGAIYSQGDVTLKTASGSITGTTITGNSVTSTNENAMGGGVAVVNANLTVGARTTISGNTATSTHSAGEGGGVSVVTGDFTADQATFSGNLASGTQAVGGGIDVESGTAGFTRSTVSDNTASGSGSSQVTGGGGVSATVGTMVTSDLSTFSGNSATLTGTPTDASAAGGAIYTPGGGITLRNSTIAFNSAVGANGWPGVGGAFAAQSGFEPFTLGGSIVAQNTQTGASQCAFAAVTSNDYNVLGPISDCSVKTAANDSTNVANANLLAPANNGGLTETIALDWGSVAFDRIPAADAQCTNQATDQRGLARPAFNGCDSGAYEARNGPSSLVAPNIKGGGSATEAIKLGANTGAWAWFPTSFGFQWVRCDADGVSNCADIGGAAQSVYVPDTNDVGHTLKVRVRGTNAYSFGDATSAASAVVAASVPVVKRLPSIRNPSTPHTGKKLSGDPGAWTPAADSYTYQWVRCDADGTSNCNDLRSTRTTRSARSPVTSIYKPTAADVGHTLRLKIFATNTTGTSAPALSAPTGVVS